MLHVPYRTDICSTIPGISFLKKHIIIINIRYCKQTSLFICKYISIYEYISCVCVWISRVITGDSTRNSQIESCIREHEK